MAADVLPARSDSHLVGVACPADRRDRLLLTDLDAEHLGGDDWLRQGPGDLGKLRTQVLGEVSAAASISPRTTASTCCRILLRVAVSSIVPPLFPVRCLFLAQSLVCRLYSPSTADQFKGQSLSASAWRDMRAGCASQGGLRNSLRELIAAPATRELGPDFSSLIPALRAAAIPTPPPRWIAGSPTWLM
jgi:hypothetical protein